MECYDSDKTYLDIIHNEIRPTIQRYFDISVEVENFAQEKPQIKIKYLNRDYIIELEHYGDYIDIGNLVKGFNKIFREAEWEERLYCIDTKGQDAAIIFITPITKRRLEQEKGWVFHQVEETDDSIVDLGNTSNQMQHQHHVPRKKGILNRLFGR